MPWQFQDIWMAREGRRLKGRGRHKRAREKKRREEREKEDETGPQRRRAHKGEGTEVT